MKTEMLLLSLEIIFVIFLGLDFTILCCQTCLCGNILFEFKLWNICPNLLLSPLIFCFCYCVLWWMLI